MRYRNKHTRCCSPVVWVLLALSRLKALDAFVVPVPSAQVQVAYKRARTVARVQFQAVGQWKELTRDSTPSATVSTHLHGGPTDSSKQLDTNTQSNTESETSLPTTTTRRQVLLNIGSSLAFASSPYPSVAEETDTAAATPPPISAPDLDCLLDLPPLKPNYGRLFLCRHGQTENNRLRMVQGARVDPPLNDRGREQAERIGLALARANPAVTRIFHSQLQRARQTAEQARDAGKLLSSGRNKNDNSQQLLELPTLTEVDFGPIAEGRPVEEALAGMMATGAQWAAGNVDYRPSGGGESGRDVLYRAIETVDTLAKAAAMAENRCVAAVSHSAYLRFLLTIFLDQPLASAAGLKVLNGSITVLDVELSGKKRSEGPNSRLFNQLSLAPRDFRLDVPAAEVVRVNEIRHLRGLM